MENCIFCKIIAGEIPANKVYEDEFIMVIEDLAPKAPLHLLLLPKRHFSNCLDMAEGDASRVGHLFRVAGDLARQKGVADSGFRLVQILNGTITTDVDQSVDSTTPDASFRWDATSQQWIST